MAYKEKVYVAFDGASDLTFYKKMKEFKNTDGIPFELISGLDLKSKFEKIPDEQLKLELQHRMNEAKVAVVFISPTTKSMRKFIRWQVDYLITNNFPIICMNLNRIRSVDFDLLSALFKKNAISLHIPFDEKVLALALEHWPASHHDLFMKEKKGTYRFPNDVYQQYIIQEEQEEMETE